MATLVEIFNKSNKKEIREYIENNDMVIDSWVVNTLIPYLKSNNDFGSINKIIKSATDLDVIEHLIVAIIGIDYGHALKTLFKSCGDRDITEILIHILPIKNNWNITNMILGCIETKKYDINRIIPYISYDYSMIIERGFKNIKTENLIQILEYSIQNNISRLWNKVFDREDFIITPEIRQLLKKYNKKLTCGLIDIR